LTVNATEIFDQSVKKTFNFGINFYLTEKIDERIAQTDEEMREERISAYLKTVSEQLNLNLNNISLVVPFHYISFVN